MTTEANPKQKLPARNKGKLREMRQQWRRKSRERKAAQKRSKEFGRLMGWLSHIRPWETQWLLEEDDFPVCREFFAGVTLHEFARADCAHLFPAPTSVTWPGSLTFAMVEQGHHGNWQMLQICFSLKSWLLTIYQHTTGSAYFVPEAIIFLLNSLFYL